jgi:hypothetical protein
MRRFYLANSVSSPFIVVFTTQRGAKTYKYNRLIVFFSQGVGKSGNRLDKTKPVIFYIIQILFLVPFKLHATP